MAPTRYSTRPIPTISLHSFPERIATITAEIVHASENTGFFCIINHGISRQAVDCMFEESARFFGQSDDVKARVPFDPRYNAGWEKNGQVRPSTGRADRKESYQMQFGGSMEGRWLPESTLPHFKSHSLAFMHQVQTVSTKLLTCLALGLGFEADYFVKAHDVSRPESQTVCRLLHYFETPKQPHPEGEKYHRAGAHADWDTLTLLFQKEGEYGLEVCPGKEARSQFGEGDEWTRIEPDAASNAIVCNIGDLLMSWSDDRFKSTLHRVKAPCEEGDYYGERYSIAFFNQPCTDAVIQGPRKKYPAVTGKQFTERAMERNFKALRERLGAAES